MVMQKPSSVSQGHLFPALTSVYNKISARELVPVSPLNCRAPLYFPAEDPFGTVLA